MRIIKPTLLILAAGLGSRYGSLKQIDKIGPAGERIIDYSVYDAFRAGFGKVVYVIRKSFEEEFKEYILDVLPQGIEYTYVCQEIDSLVFDSQTNPTRMKPWGTGHALLTASSVIKEPFAVINADDFYGAASYKIAVEFLNWGSRQKAPVYAMIGYTLENTLSDYGYVSRGICELDDKDHLISLIERTKIKKEDSKFHYLDEHNNGISLTGKEIVSMNMFLFYPDVFNSLLQHFRKFIKEQGNSIDAEFYLPVALNNLLKTRAANIKVLKTNESWFGLTYPEDKEIAINKISSLVNEKKYPENLWRTWQID